MSRLHIITASSDQWLNSANHGQVMTQSESSDKYINHGSFLFCFPKVLLQRHCRDWNCCGLVVPEFDTAQHCCWIHWELEMPSAGITTWTLAHIVSKSRQFARAHLSTKGRCVLMECRHQQNCLPELLMSFQKKKKKRSDTECLVSVDPADHSFLLSCSTWIRRLHIEHYFQVSFLVPLCSTCICIYIYILSIEPFSTLLSSLPCIFSCLHLLYLKFSLLYFWSTCCASTLSYCNFPPPDLFSTLYTLLCITFSLLYISIAALPLRSENLAE